MFLFRNVKLMVDSGDVPIGDETLKEITEVVRKAGVNLEGKESEGTEDKGFGGWDGGVVWLVPTDKPIAEWKPIATRELEAGSEIKSF